MYIIKKSEGYKTIKSYYEVISSKKKCNFDMTPTLMNYFKYAPITCVDVKLSFSLQFVWVFNAMKTGLSL